MTLLDAEGLRTVYGDGCDRCLDATGDRAGTNQCPHCGSVVACAEADLTVRAGEVLGIVGESGSGKSSLAEQLALERDPDAETDGVVRYAGHEGNLLDVDYETRHDLRTGDIALVHQHIRDGLNPEFTGGGNVAEKLLSAGWRSFEDVRARVRELFEATEIPVDRMDDPTSTYSGGMQRRVQIARALANDPELVVLDEPTTGLDVSVQARVLDMFRRVQREKGVAAVVVSHDLGVVRLLADRTLVMRHGRVVESGLTDRVMEDPHHEYTQTLINSVI
ncbi:MULTISPECIES: ATP-binding cassette domain-containing protein [Haloarcula]|uniref:ABC transporter ATP-binding protein n=1 Tax=Haloarcula pellucida TaxID=1427151 RepID=A0A830GNK4_9EURY|nr:MULTISPECIES: ATP-binding cassette domain-containing protein [Halomicroarcula]MBX0348209.1 ATP-binding cassette domain-containing protein [Halomicroarcula pellucida]MDS0278063.1 ATP-binding cassette domain-containing protein [Halomicroarcula sp. S1AR25-4]GGN97501.1 ABC transporter ATP-binding protein [Halomicroarcula pellucida]